MNLSFEELLGHLVRLHPGLVTGDEVNGADCVDELCHLLTKLSSRNRQTLSDYATPWEEVRHDEAELVVTQ